MQMNEDCVVTLGTTDPVTTSVVSSEAGCCMSGDARSDSASTACTNKAVINSRLCPGV